MLEKRFRNVERAADAAGAFIRIEEPGFADRLALVIAGLREPGIAGPEFVSEITRRIPSVPVLVIGRSGEIAPDYRGEQVRFLPSYANNDDILAAAWEITSLAHPRVA